MRTCASWWFLPLILSGISLSCQAPLQLGDEIYDLDYYFGPDYIQIQGRARLPGVVLVKPDVQKGKQTEAEPSGFGAIDHKEYRSYSQRRRLCQQAALTNAHTKWLSITDRKWLSQAEWKLRLRLGEKSAWNECLQEAKVLSVHYDKPGQCRLVVRYFCDPRRY